MKPKRCRRSLASAVLISLSLLAIGCNSLGDRQVPSDSLDYNKAINRSLNEQMLLNLVRLRYGETPVFLTLSSVLTQYTYTGSLSTDGGGGEAAGFPVWSLDGNAMLRYRESPTITYSPLSGQEFVTQLLRPVTADAVFSLVQSGWPPEQLLLMTLQRMNHLATGTFAETHDNQRAEFLRVLELIVLLSEYDAIEIQVRSAPARRDGKENEQRPTLVLRRDLPPEVQPLADEFRNLLGLDPNLTAYTLTTRLVDRAPGEVTVRVRSLLELIGFLAQGVRVPPQHMDEKRAYPVNPRMPLTEPLLQVHSSKDRPRDTFAAVWFKGYWFSIQERDQESKRAFGLLRYLFQMQAPKPQGGTPLVTVSSGG